MGCRGLRPTLATSCVDDELPTRDKMATARCTVAEASEMAAEVEVERSPTRCRHLDGCAIKAHRDQN